MVLLKKCKMLLEKWHKMDSLVGVMGPTAYRTLTEDLLPKAVVAFGLYFLGYFHLHTFLVIVSVVYVVMSFTLDPKTFRRIMLILTPYKALIIFVLHTISRFNAINAKRSPFSFL